MFSFLKGKEIDAASGGWSARLRAGLERTRKILNTDLGDLFSGARIDEARSEEHTSELQSH